MEGLFRDGNNAVAEAAHTMRTSLIGRTLKAADKAVKTAADTTFKAVIGPSLECRGYRLLGLNTAPRSDKGLSRGQREVRFTSYATEAEPFLREARIIAETLMASHKLPATGLTLGSGEILMRVVFPSTLDSLESSYEFTNKSKGGAFLGPCLACAGGNDLTVVDIRVTEHTLASTTNIVDKLFGSTKAMPAFYLRQAVGAVAAKVAKSLKGGISTRHSHYVKFEDAASEEQYLYSVKLLVLALYLNRAQRGVHTAAHVAALDNAYIPILSDSEDDEYGEGVWFTTDHKNEALDKLERSIAALTRRQGHASRLIPCLPATQFTGTPYKEMTVRMSDEQYDELLKQSLQAENGGTQNAFYCGPNISGARPPLDTKHPLTWATAYTRHFCKVEKTLLFPDGTTMDIVVDKADKQMPKLGAWERTVWSDITAQHSALFADWLASGGNLEFEGKPHSHTREEYEVIRGEIEADPLWGRRKLIRATLNLKAGEGGDRGRFITLPGVSNADAKRHQCASSEFVQIIEAFHQAQFGFRNYKGATVTGKARKTARMIAHCNEGYVCVGFDKGANDRTWNHRKWEAFEAYTEQLGKVLTTHLMETEAFTSYLEANGQHAEQVVWDGLYITVTADVQYWYLMSALNPTSLCNRLQADVGIGAGILQGWGKEYYTSWLQWCSGVDASPLDFIGEIDEELPHVLEGVDAKEHHYDGFMHYAEGDDTCIKIPCGKRTNAQAVTHFARSVNMATNEVWEAAYVDEKHLNTHGATRSCVEVMSMVIAQKVTDEGFSEFAYLPKPVKRLDKLAWTLSGSLRVVETVEGKVGVLDATYHRLNATRCLSMCKEMQYCLWVRRIMYATAKFHVEQLRRLDQFNGIDTPLYGDRTQEQRKMPDAPGLIGDSIERALYAIGKVLDQTDISTQVVLEANANAWALHSPSVLADGKALRATLLELDRVASMIDISWDYIENPMNYLSLFQLGPLEVAFSNCCERLANAVEFADANKDLPLEVLRDQLLRSVKATKGGNKIGAKAQSHETAPPAKTGQGSQALDRGSKGNKASGSRDSKWTPTGNSRWTRDH